MARITTVIPVFNGDRYLQETLDSLAQQTVRPDRVVLLDDGSTDRTREILTAFKEISCEWMPNERNLGLFPNHNRALNFGLETEYLHILHADDTLLPHFFEKLVSILKNSPPMAMAYCGHKFIRDDGSSMGRVSTFGESSPRQLSLREFLTRQSELKSIQVHSVLLKTCFRSLPVQFRTDFPQLGDILFHAELAPHCSEIWALPKVLCTVRTHDAAASNKNIRNLDAWVIDEWRAMQIIYNLMREHRIATWSRKLKLDLLFAARTHVKAKMFRKINPAYAHQINSLGRGKTNFLGWALARAIVESRDLFFPARNTGAERLNSANKKDERQTGA
jgi:glycosyltransferase involved in cell wall biosynthesis